MRKKRLLILLWAIITALPATAQWSIGASGGYAINLYNYDPQYMEGMNYDAHHGFVVDIPVRYQFNDWLTLSSGCALQQKGFALFGSCVLEGEDHPSYFYKNLRRHDTYLLIPLMAEFSFGKGKWKGFVDVGGYAGWWWQSKFAYKSIFSVSIINSSETHHDIKHFNKNVDQRWEFGAVAGLGVNYKLSNLLSFFSAVRCYAAFTPQQKEYQTMHFPSYNVTITAQCGVLFYLK